MTNNNISLKNISSSELLSWYIIHSKKSSLNEKEEKLLALILEQLRDADKTLSDIPSLLAGGDIIDLALDLRIPEALQSFTRVKGRIDVPSSNDCPTRRGTLPIRLPDSYSYYDHRYDELNANPKPGNVKISQLKTGVDASWEVPFIGTFIGPWCGGERSWLLAEITVRGVLS